MQHVYYMQECASTNDEILNFLRQESKDFVALYTFKQTKGRGQYGNLWENSQNMNIACSLALKESSLKTSSSLFNFYTAVLVQEFLANLTHSEVFIKWPNDIIIKNKKVCGILIEKKRKNNDPYYIIGIGINVLQQDFSAFPNGGSLLTQTQQAFDLHEVSEQICAYFQKNFTENVSENEILQKFNNLLYRKNKISVFEENGIRQNGIIKHADKEGYLWIEMENSGLKKFYHKEIQMLY